MALSVEELRGFDLGSTSVLNAAFTEYGRIAGTYHGELVIYDGRVSSIPAHDGQLLAIIERDTRIYTSGSDGFVRSRRGGKLGETELGGFVYALKRHPAGLVAANDSGEVFLMRDDLSDPKRIYKYPEGRPALDAVVIGDLIAVGFYDGNIVVLKPSGRVVAEVPRTPGDSVTFMRASEELKAIVSGYRSGRISIVPYRDAGFEVSSGRSKRVVRVKKRSYVDLQTIGSVVRRAGVINGRLLALGGNGTLFEQELNKLLRAALGTRGTRIIARHRAKLHEYGANGANMEFPELITAGLDGYVRLRRVGL